jgi:hypothetical protein
LRANQWFAPKTETTEKVESKPDFLDPESWNFRFKEEVIEGR